MAGGAWTGCVHGREGHSWQGGVWQEGAYMAVGDVHGRGACVMDAHPSPGRYYEIRAVRIVLECILVCKCFDVHFSPVFMQ